MDIDPESIVHSPFAVGALGALLTALKFTTGENRTERFINAAINVAGGTAVAGFITPPLMEWLHRPMPIYISAAAFLLGLMGMSLVAALVQAVKDTPFGQILTGWLTRRG